MYPVFLALLLLSLPASAADAIRSFSIATLADLGRELYERDQMAANASDALFAAHPDARSRSMRGWITYLDSKRRAVYFIKEQEGSPTLGYLVTLRGAKASRIEDAKGTPLPDFIAKRYSARTNAVAAIPKRMAKRYNVEVLDDPDGSGFLVYVLAASAQPDEIMASGHYRITVAANGSTIERIDALSRSLLVLKKEAASAGMVLTHMVSDTPVETHVYSSLLHKIPFYIATSPETIWKVSEGRIQRVEK